MLATPALPRAKVLQRTARAPAQLWPAEPLLSIGQRARCGLRVVGSPSGSGPGGRSLSREPALLPLGRAASQGKTGTTLHVGLETSTEPLPGSSPHGQCALGPGSWGTSSKEGSTHVRGSESAASVQSQQRPQTPRRQAEGLLCQKRQRLPGARLPPRGAGTGARRKSQPHTSTWPSFLCVCVFMGHSPLCTCPPSPAVPLDEGPASPSNIQHICCLDSFCKGPVSK